MSDSSKDEILANFQACSGIENIEEAMALLSSCNWDLVVALNKVFQEDDVMPTARVVHEPQRPIPLYPTGQQVAEMIDLVESPEDISPIIEFPPSLPSTSSALNNVASGGHTSKQSSSTNYPVIDVNIEMLCGGATSGSSFPLELPGSSTVGELQTMLHQLVGINPCSQILEGFTQQINPNTVITPTLLPDNKTLTLNVGTSNYFTDRVNCMRVDSYRLLIHDEKSKKDYSLNYDGSKTVRSVKDDMFGITKITVRHQKWMGWPPGCNDNKTLSQSGIGKEHHFTVSSLEKSERTPKTSRKVVDGVESQEDSSNDDDEFLDACDIIPDEDLIDMLDVPPSQRVQSLIPPNIEEELPGVLSFVEEFKARFRSSPNIPSFHQGTLEEAMKESLLLSARRRKLLAVYLHHDGSVLSNVFCSQALCHASVVDYLTVNFVIWGWDLTHESNKAQLLNIISNHFGSMAPMTIRNFGVEKLPVLLIITRNRGTNEILAVIHGDNVLDEVMTSLIHQTELFEDTRRGEVIEEDARELREREISEQDSAYHVSLEIDRKKEETKKMAEMEVREERERKESERQQTEQIKEAVRQSLEGNLETEPPVNCIEPITMLRFRVPNEEPFDRRFKTSSKIQTVLNYLCIKGFAPDEYKCHLSYPKRDITSIAPEKSLAEMGVNRQETLTVERKDTGED